VARQIPTYLRLHTEPAAECAVAAATVAGAGELGELCRTFEQATGWPLRFVPGADTPDRDDTPWSAAIGADDRRPQGHLRLELGGPLVVADGPRADLEAASDLAAAVAMLMNRLARAEEALREREAELAAGVPVVARPDDGRKLAGVLESLLAGAARALDCQAAGLYLLDDATSELKLRSAWGLPGTRLADPARPLAGATADLEAMAGHAVVLRDTEHAPLWNAPEDFAAALCVPVASDTTVHGTLWLFAPRPRDFDDRQAQLAEVVAGRLATELEREVLAREAQRGAQAQRELDAAVERQREALPTVAPLCAGWEAAAWAEASAPAAGTFFDWCPLPGDRLGLTLMEVEGTGIRAGADAAALRAAWRAHGEHLSCPSRMIEALNRAAWSGSAGDLRSAALVASVAPGDGLVSLAWAGNPAVYHVGAGRIEPATQLVAPLGADPGLRVAQWKRLLSPGELLVAMPAGLRDAVERSTGAPLPEALERTLRGPSESAARAVERLRGWLDPLADVDAAKRALLVLRRTE
jgi:hypothetical protein